jgi:hypothetical protein
MNAVEILLNNIDLYLRFLDVVEENTVNIVQHEGKTHMSEYFVEHSYSEEECVPYEVIEDFMRLCYNPYLDTVEASNGEDYTQTYFYVNLTGTESVFREMITTLDKICYDELDPVKLEACTKNYARQASQSAKATAKVSLKGKIESADTSVNRDALGRNNTLKLLEYIDSYRSGSGGIWGLLGVKA